MSPGIFTLVTALFPLLSSSLGVFQVSVIQVQSATGLYYERFFLSMVGKGELKERVGGADPVLDGSEGH
jgi:hypothetical protein